MNYVIINHKNIKVTLTQYELDHMYEVVKSNETNQSEKLNLSPFLNEISDKTGFIFKEHRLIIRLFESKNGGGELFISCVSGKFIKPIQKRRFRLKNNRIILIKLNFEALCMLSRRLIHEKTCITADVYYGKDHYFLVLRCLNNRITYPAYLSEYGNTHELTVDDELYLKEYYNVLAEKNALYLFSKL